MRFRRILNFAVFYAHKLNRTRTRITIRHIRVVYIFFYDFYMRIIRTNLYNVYIFARERNRIIMLLQTSHLRANGRYSIITITVLYYYDDITPSSYISYYYYRIE